MATTGHRKTKAMKSVEADIISNLPRNITQNILKRMPIQDAVRTSTLSRKWKYNWSTLPELEFGQHFFESFDSVSIISKLLLLHSGPILKFVLHIPPNIRFTEREVNDINQWILFLSRNGLQKFTFENSSGLYGEPHKLPSHLFSCLQLTHLKLCKCSLFPPVTFEGFPNLINLELHSVVLPTDLFRGFLSSCPRLERLIVEICIAADQLYIHSPTLRHLHVSGSLGFINIENAQGLITLTISSRLALRNPEHITSSNMIQLLGRLPNLEKLSLDDFLHKYLAAGDVPKRLPAALNCLKTLTLSDMDFRNSYGEIYSALCLIRSSPNLQELEISAFNNNHSAVSDPGINFWEEKCTMSQLRTVKFTCVEGLTTELKLIKYILACSPSLEKVYVEREKVADARAGLMTSFMISKELMRFHRASPKAEVVYSDPSEAMFA